MRPAGHLRLAAVLDAHEQGRGWVGIGALSFSAGTVSATNARSLLARSVFSATRHYDQPFGQGGGVLGEVKVLAGRGVPQHRVGRGDGAFRLWLRKAAE